VTYLARITECEHGHCGVCMAPVFDLEKPLCPGGTTTRIEPDYEAAAIAWENQYDDMESDGVNIHAVVDAALGEPTKGGNK
jgi:hypothetical protein